ncbi:MAG: hypothetical protein A2Z16_06650 [Chloroflexi bacterium RBG_16_54_18]|nr:MAG: hypothetical protein A2Z16_06650 [Chloroflexi bacterium RBG_16_54_18]
MFPKIILAILLSATLVTSRENFHRNDMNDDIHNTTISVNSISDAPDAIPGDGICETAAGNNLCTLRAAIQETNVLVGADTISLPAGNYILSILGAGENDSATGDLDINDSLTITGSATISTVIDGNGLDRVIDNYSTVFLSDLTITGGQTNTWPGGGGVLNNGSLSLTNVTVSNNQLFGINIRGGGIYNLGLIHLMDSNIASNIAEVEYVAVGGVVNYGELIMFGGEVSTNISRGNGGGISNFGIATFQNVTIRDNQVTKDCSNGGGIHNWEGELTISGSSIRNNISGGGGSGIYNYHSIANITGSNIESNSSTCFGAVYGGGIYNTAMSEMKIENSTVASNYYVGMGGGIANEGSELTILNSTISENTALSDGGGIHNGYNGTIYLTNVTISNNSAGTSPYEYGGGIYNETGTFVILNSTIAENSAGMGGGIALSAGLVRLKNSLFWANTTGNCSGSITSEGNNIENGSMCGLSQPSDLSNTNPRIGLLENNGGPTLTHALLRNSPATDLGDNSVCPIIDQRGFGRPVDGNQDGNSICDSGAFEYGAIVYTPKFFLPLIIK